jgi:RNA polymerase sigma-70 factor (ECF subfamily)
VPRLVASQKERRRVLEEASDRELLAALRQDDDLALDALIGRKTQPLLQLAFRILGDLEEARDVVQVTFIRIWEHRQRFDDRWSPNTWIYRIATNLAIDQLRARRHRERSAEPAKYHLRRVAAAGAARELGSLSGREVMAIFRQLSRHLTDKQRSVFILREVEDLSCREVAKIVGCRESTVRNHLFNARKVLRRELQRRFPEYAGDLAARTFRGEEGSRP